MSFQSRQKKRRYKRIEAKKPGRHTCCGTSFDRGAEIVYRHEPREIRCLSCADRDPECSYRPSIRWERARRVPKAIA